jgi:TolB-like protein
MSNNTVLCPEGWGVNLDYAVTVSIVKAEETKVKFHIEMVNGKQEHFLYPYDRYDEPKDELFNKVNIIRNIILKKINNGEQPVEVLGNINLKKI